MRPPAVAHAGSSGTHVLHVLEARRHEAAWELGVSVHLEVELALVHHGALHPDHTNLPKKLPPYYE
jgi:hypothetical protein